jgi:hypothetical protein
MLCAVCQHQPQRGGLELKDGDWIGQLELG